MASHSKAYDTITNYPIDPDAGKELEKHFEVIGQISRVTIVKDKLSQQPKGIAYVQFANEESVSMAKVLDGKNFYGRPINVIPKLKSLQSEQQQALVANAQRGPNAAAGFVSSYNR